MNWRTIKYFGKVKYFNISYAAILIIPIYIDFASKLNNSIGFEISQIPISIRLIYLASLSYALGIAIYQYFCPNIIKEYDKVQDYIRDNFEILLKSYPDLKYQIVTTNLDDDLQSQSKKKIEELNQKIIDGNTDEKIKSELKKLIDSFLPSCVQNYLNNDFTSALTKNKRWMIASLVFYIVGTAIVFGLLINKSIVVLTF